MAQKRHRLRKFARGLARWVGYLFAGLIGLIVLAFLCINLKPARSFIRDRVNKTFASSFTGTLAIDRIGYISPYSVGGVDAHVLDARGRPVIVSRGLSATCHWPSIVWDLLRKRPLTVTLTPVRSEHLELILIDDGQGSPTFASAFSPRTPSAPSTSPSKGPPTTISIPKLTAKHIWAHGGLAALPGIDTELTDLAVGLRSRGSELDVRLDGVRVLARNLPAAVNPRGKFVGHLSLRGETKTTLSATLDFDGTLSGAAATLHAAINDKHVEAKLRAPAVPASVLTAQVPALAVRGPTRVELDARGDLPRIDFEGVVKNAAIDAKFDGHVALEDTLSASATLHANEVDASGLVADAPPTRLDVTAKLDARVPKQGPLTATYEVRVPPGVAQGFATPNLRVSGKVAQSPESGVSVDGAVNVEEPGVNAVGLYRYRATRQNRQSLSSELLLELANSSRLEKLAGVTTRGTVEAKVTLDLSAQQIEAARVKVALAPLVHGSDRLASLTAEVRASGSLKSPTLDLEANVRRGSVSGQAFKKLLLSGAGTKEHFTVRGALDRDSEQHVDFQTTVAAGNATKLLATSLSLRTDAAPINVRARSVSFADERLTVDGLELDGAGTLALSGHYGRGEADAAFEIDKLDVARLSRSLRVKTPVAQSLISGKGHVKGPVRRLQGKVEMHVRKIELEHVQGGSVDVDLNIQDQIATGTVDATLGESRMSAKLEDVLVPAPGAALGLHSLQGKLSVNGAVELSRIAGWLRAAGAPVESATGHVELELTAESPKERRGLPTTHLRVKTQALKLVEQRPQQKEIDNATAAVATQPRALQGVDVDLQFSLDPKANQAKLAGSVFDRRGPMLLLDGETQLPPEGVSLGDAMARTAVKVSARVPARELDQLPISVRPAYLHGVVQANIEAEGTMHAPKLMATAGVRGFRTREGGRRAVDAELMLRYDRTRGALRGSASTTRQPNALVVSSDWNGDLFGKLAKAPGSDLDLNAEVKLDKFPVTLVPVLSDRALRGPLSCDIKLENLGKDAKLTGKVDGSGLKMGDVQLQKLDLNLTTEHRQLVAKLETSEQKGSLRVDVNTPLTWGQELAPTIDPHAKAKLTARRFQLATLSPLLLEYVSDIQGQLDADLAVELGESAPKVQGTADVRDGVVQIPQIGQRFSDVTAKLKVDADGKVKLDSLQARGTSGRVTANAEAAFQGTNLTSAKAHAQISKSEKLPITMEGVSLGDAWGKVDVAYRHADNASQIRVDVPEFFMEMPETGFGNIQNLDPDEHVRVGVFRSDKKFAVMPTQPLRSTTPAAASDAPPSTTLVQVHLGDSVWIERGQQAKVQLTGDLNVTSGAKSKIQGRIELRGGTLDVNGKTFSIENGVVSFDGDDPGDPTITATARWDAPEATAVFAEYSGTVKAGKLTLHSEPPLTQPEIVSLLLFGSPEGSLGSSDGGGGGAAATAVGVAGGTAVKGFNRVMSDFTHLDVSARIDTSTGSARPEIVVQVTPRLTTRVARALGEPAPGQSPDRTFLTLELRLLRSWAVSAVVGDRGASVLDLIWRRRY